MQRCRVLIADDNPAFAESLRRHIALHPDMEVLAVVSTGCELLELLETKAHWLDALVLDVEMPEVDGFAVLQRLRQMKRDREQAAGGGKGILLPEASLPFRVILVSPSGDDTLVTRAYEEGADYFVVKPFDLETLVSRIRLLVFGRLPSHGEPAPFRRNQVERAVAHLLGYLGVPPHFKGYVYLLEAVTLAVLDPGVLSRVTREVYDRVAERHGTTAAKVERAIRHAVEMTFVRGNLEATQALFAHTVDRGRAKPPNSAFIASASEWIRLHLRPGNDAA